MKTIKEAIKWLITEHGVLFAPFIMVKASFFFLSVTILSKFIKKSDNKIYIGFTAMYYDGNPRAVFEHLNKQDNKFECYWIARNKISYKQAKEHGSAVELFSFKSISYFLKTNVFVTADVVSIFSFIPREKYKIIQLWHGVGPKGIPTEDYEKIDARCVTSEYTKQRHKELWHAPEEKIYVTGFARMDFLYNYLKMPPKKLLKEVGLKNDRKIILYAPTFDVGLWPWGDAYDEFETLCSFCKENDLILILRLHPFAKVKRGKLKKILKKYEYVYWLNMSKEPDTMKLLAISDILVTDWSSIYTDYFLTKRSIIYLEVNKEYFTKIRGKPEIPPELRDGEIVHNNEEFYEALTTVLKSGNKFKNEQEKLLKIIHGDVDGNSSGRVVEVIEKLLNL